MQTFAQKQTQSQQPTSSSPALSNLATPGLNRRADLMLHLQRTIGNQAVLRMLQTQELEGGLTGTASPRFRQDFGRIPIHQPVVQRKALSADKKDTAAAVQVQADAPYVLWVMDDVFQGYARLIDQAPSAYRSTLGKLLTVKNGIEKGLPIPGRQRREIFDEVTRVLGPIMAHADADQNRHMAEIRTEVLLSEARDRIEHSFSDDKKKTIEIPTDSHPREQAEVLRARLQKLISAMHDIHEIGLKYGEPLIEDVAHHMEEGHPGHGAGNTLGRLQELQAVLHLADGWLKLTDEEFQHELTHIKGVFHWVSTYAELVKAVIELGGGAVSLTATFAAGIARLSGDVALSASASSVARTIGMKLGDIVAAIEIVHGAAMLFDPNSTRAQRIEGGVEIGMGVGFLAGGGAGAMVVGGPYFLAKSAAYLYWQGAIGLNTGFLLPLYQYMQEQGGFIANNADALARAGMLGRDEKDPEKAAALAAEEQRLAIKLGGTIDSFLDRCRSSGGSGQGWGKEFQHHYPGNWPILAEAFAPILDKRGARTGPQAATAAAAVLDKISWCFINASDILIASVRHMDLAQMEAEEAKKKAAEPPGEEK
jgi:hypothetical protein